MVWSLALHQHTSFARSRPCLALLRAATVRLPRAVWVCCLSDSAFAPAQEQLLMKRAASVCALGGVSVLLAAQHCSCSQAL